MALFYQPNIVIQDLKFAYDAANPKCYAGVGTFVNDLSGNNNNGYLYSGVGFSSNLAGYFTFDGVDDYIGTNFQPNYDYITVNVWFWSGAFSTFGTNTCVVANSQLSSPYPSFDIRKRITGALQLQFAISSSGTEIGQDIGFINDYTWYNVQFTYDGSTVKCWLNGVQVINYSIAGTLRNSTSFLQIAKNPSFAGRNAAIYVSQLFIYNRALTDSEIQRNYNATKQRYIYTEDIIFDNLVVNYDPGNNLSAVGTGSSVVDLSGFNTHAILLNGPVYSGVGNTRSIVFDGVDDYIQLSSAYSETFTAGTTVDVWVKFNASGSYARLLDISNGAGSNTVFLSIFRWVTTGSIVLEARSTSTQGSQSGVRTTNNVISNGTIQNFTFVIQGGATESVSSNPKIYLNGEEQSLTAYGASPYVPYVVSKTAWIGRSAFTADAYLSANIYNYRIYNKALSPAEIKQNFQALRGRYGI